MNPIYDKVVKPVVSRSMDLATKAFKNSRVAAETTSEWIASSTKTVKLVSDKALKLNKLSHNTLAKLLAEQSDIVEGNLHAVANRLDLAANADNLRDLWSDQVDLMPETRQRVTKDAQKVISIFANTGEELRDLVAETVTDISNRADDVAESAKKTAKSAKKTAKKATKKAVKKTKTVAKTAKKKATKTAKTAKKKATKAAKTTRKTAQRRTKRAA